MVTELLERLRVLSDDDRRSLLAFMAGRNTVVLSEAMDAWEQKVRGV